MTGRSDVSAALQTGHGARHERCFDEVFDPFLGLLVSYMPLAARAAALAHFASLRASSALGASLVGPLYFSERRLTPAVRKTD